MNTFKQSTGNDYIYYKIGPVVHEEKILKFQHVFLQFCYHLPLLKGGAFPFEQTYILFTHGCFFAKFG